MYWQNKHGSCNETTSGAANKISFCLSAMKRFNYWKFRLEKASNAGLSMSLLDGLQDTSCPVCNAMLAFNSAKPAVVFSFFSNLKIAAVCAAKNKHHKASAQINGAPRHLGPKFVLLFVLWFCANNLFSGAPKKNKYHLPGL